MYVAILAMLNESMEILHVTLCSMYVCSYDNVNFHGISQIMVTHGYTVSQPVRKGVC